MKAFSEDIYETDYDSSKDINNNLLLNDQETISIYYMITGKVSKIQTSQERRINVFIKENKTFLIIQVILFFHTIKKYYKLHIIIIFLLCFQYTHFKKSLPENTMVFEDNQIFKQYNQQIFELRTQCFNKNNRIHKIKSETTCLKIQSFRMNGNILFFRRIIVEYKNDKQISLKIKSLNNIMKQNFNLLFGQPQLEIRLRDNENNRIIQAQISESQKYLATTYSYQFRQSINLWDLKNKKKIKDIEIEKTLFLPLFEFSFDNQIFFYAKYAGYEINMIYLNDINLILKSIDIEDYLDKVIFNQKHLKAVIIHNDKNIFSFWNIIEKQKEFQVQTQNELLNSLFLDMKKFLIVSSEEFEFIHFSIYSSDQQKIINQWKGKYISKEMKLHYNRDDQLLVVDFQDEYEHYIQIWSLYNFILIKHLYNDISDFNIKRIQGISLIAEIEDESDEENESDDDNPKDVNESQLQNNCVTIGIYNLLTGKINKGQTNIQKENQFFFVDKILFQQQILEDKISDIILSFY